MDTPIAANIRFGNDGSALVTMRSPFTGEVHQMRMKLTKEQWETWKSGTMIQNALPHLTPDEREFLMTGITAEEWEAAFGHGGH